jgi:hypothetical protein
LTYQRLTIMIPIGIREVMFRVEWNGQSRDDELYFAVDNDRSPFAGGFPPPPAAE